MSAAMYTRKVQSPARSEDVGEVDVVEELDDEPPHEARRSTPNSATTPSRKAKRFPPLLIRNVGLPTAFCCDITHPFPTRDNVRLRHATAFAVSFVT